MRTQRSILEQAGLASGLLQEEQIDHAWQVLVESLPAADLSLEEIDDQQLAAQLVQLGYLNRWQAEQLCQGRTKFTLGSYRILDAIGQGGMGWVFKGEHVLLGRIEAIKVLPKNQSTPSSIQSFLREIRAQACLDHPNLVRLSYADQDGETYFLVTEYISGTDLRRFVRTHGALPQEKAAVILSQAAKALEYAHGCGLIHRDVKPSNLLITLDGITKLADLGLAVFSDEAAPARLTAKHIVGTADFLAPEIIMNPDQVRPLSDIYSLGCTLYYAVTGKVPYPSGSTATKLRRQLEQEPLPPKRLNPHLDDDFVQVIEAMMAKQPAARTATAAAVVDQLAPWVSRAGASIYAEIGQQAEIQGEPEYGGAQWADTVEASYESAKIPCLPTSVKTIEPIAASPNQPQQREHISEEKSVTGLGRKTTVFVTLAVLVAVTAVCLVLYSV